MSGVARFEDLLAWQKAMALAIRVYEHTKGTPVEKDWALAGQIRRAISIPANISEGFERSRPAEFHQFLSIAKSSCAELRSHLHLANAIGYLDAAVFDALLQQAEEVSRIVGGLRSSVARRLRKKVLSPGTLRRRR